MQTLSTASPPAEERVFLDNAIVKAHGRPGALLGILEAAQEKSRYKYLPPETLRYIAAKMDLPLARIYSVATFYALFNLQPQGKNTICICRGTACHTRGSRNLLQGARLELGLGLEEAEGNGNGGGNDADKLLLTTSDRQFTVRTVACFGQCAMAPVVEINHRICGHATERTLQREIATIRAGE